MKERPGFVDCIGQDIRDGDYLRLFWRDGKNPEFYGVETAFKLEV